VVGGVPDSLFARSGSARICIRKPLMRNGRDLLSTLDVQQNAKRQQTVLLGF
jgi:hypothetical protein